MRITEIQCSAAGDASYRLRRSSCNPETYYIKNIVTEAIVWNGAFRDVDSAIDAAEMDGFEFEKLEVL